MRGPISGELIGPHILFRGANKPSKYHKAPDPGLRPNGRSQTWNEEARVSEYDQEVERESSTPPLFLSRMELAFEAFPLLSSLNFSQHPRDASCAGWDSGRRMLS